MRLAKRIRLAGFILVGLCAAGFFTVADDWRHTGELKGVGAVGLVGLVLLAWSWRASRASNP